MTDKELMQMALDALIDAADSQNWEMQQNIDQHGEWYRRSLYLKQATTNSQAAIEALRARLAQPEPEPVWVEVTTNTGGKFILDSAVEADKIKAAKNVGLSVIPLYTAPPQREWQGLTDKEILADDVLRYHFGLNGGAGPVSKKGKAIIAAVETKLRGKNHG